MSSKSKDFISKIDNEVEVKEDPVEEVATMFDHYDLHEALLWIQDILERGNINFVVLGDIAQQMYSQDNPSLYADRIELGVLRKHFTNFGRRMISSWIPEALDENLTFIKVDYENVPIYIKIIDEDPGYLENPDKRFYYVSDFYLPNPMEKYLNDRNN